MRKWTLAVALLAVACGDKGGFASPEAVGQPYVAAITSDKPADLTALFPPDSVVNAAVSCPTGAKSLLEEIKKAEKDLSEKVARAKGMKVDLVSAQATGKKQSFAKDSEQHGCKVLADIEVVLVELKVRVTRDGKTSDEDKSVYVGRFGGGPWYLVGN